MHTYKFILLTCLVIDVSISLSCAKPEVPNVCASIACSNRGTCAIANGTTAVCICEAGTHSEAMECVADVISAECTGVTCSGHGTCVVVKGTPDYPLCRCETNFSAQGTTNCAQEQGACAGVVCSGQGTCAVQDESTPVCQCNAGYISAGDFTQLPLGERSCVAVACTKTSDCDAGTSCTYENGLCESNSSACGLPVTSTGTVMLNTSCDYTGTKGCSPGLTCVAQEFGIDPNGLAYHKVTGRCRPSCDPCASTCGSGESCIRLVSGGGFCGVPLIRQGASSVLTDFCAGANPRSSGCMRTCRPASAAWAQSPRISIGAVEQSSDCSEGELCAQATASANGNLFRCTAGQMVADGAQCDRTHGLFCKYPLNCYPTSTRSELTFCTTVCSSTLPCASGWSCTGNYCMKDGEGIYGAGCTEDKQCKAALRCINGLCTRP